MMFLKTVLVLIVGMQPFVTRVGDTVVVDSEDKTRVAEWLLKNFPI